MSIEPTTTGMRIEIKTEKKMNSKDKKHYHREKEKGRNQQRQGANQRVQHVAQPKAAQSKAVHQVAQSKGGV